MRNSSRNIAKDGQNSIRAPDEIEDDAGNVGINGAYLRQIDDSAIEVAGEHEQVYVCLLGFVKSGCHTGDAKL